MGLYEPPNSSNFARDMNLIFNNCKTYNADGSAIWKFADRLQKYLKKLMKNARLPKDTTNSHPNAPIPTAANHKQDSAGAISSVSNVTTVPALNKNSDPSPLGKENASSGTKELESSRLKSTFARKILTKVKAMQGQEGPLKDMFLHPVTENLAPNYYSIINKPMSLMQVTSK